MVIDNNDVDEKAIKWKIKYHAMRAATKHKSKFVETSVKSIPLTQIHDHSLSWFSTDTLIIKRGGVILVVWPKLPLSVPIMESLHVYSIGG